MSISVTTGEGKGGKLSPIVIGLDPEIRANPLRSVKVVGGRDKDRLCIHGHRGPWSTVEACL